MQGHIIMIVDDFFLLVQVLGLGKDIDVNQLVEYDLKYGLLNIRQKIRYKCVIFHSCYSINAFDDCFETWISVLVSNNYFGTVTDLFIIFEEGRQGIRIETAEQVLNKIKLRHSRRRGSGNSHLRVRVALSSGLYGYQSPIHTHGLLQASPGGVVGNKSDKSETSRHSQGSRYDKAFFHLAVY